MITDVLSTLTGVSINDASHVIKQGWQGSRPFMTGCLIITKDVYSVCMGTVIDVGIDNKNNLYSVTVEYDYSLWLRYCLLKSCDVKVGDSVDQGTKIGTAYKDILRFEYCTDTFSVFPVRCGENQLYKHDPMPVLAGEVSLTELDDPGNIVILEPGSSIPDEYIGGIDPDVEDE